jgi:hypothetical protein
MPEQQRQSRVLAQLRQILAALAAGRPSGAARPIRSRERRGPCGPRGANRPSTSSELANPRRRRLTTTAASSTAAAPLARNASISNGTPPKAVSDAVSARTSSSNGSRV